MAGMERKTAKRRPSLFIKMSVLATLCMMMCFPGQVYAKRVVKIAHAMIGEHGKKYDTVPGDQSGNEVSISGFTYKKTSWSGWTSIDRAKDPEIGKRIAAAAIAATKNNHVGYGKGYPDFYAEAEKVGFNMAAIGVDCECDCVGFAATCAMAGGFMLGESYEPYSEAYFTRIEDPAVCSNPDLLQLGDILTTINNKHYHMAVVCEISGSGSGSSVGTVSIENMAPALKKAKAGKGKITVNWKKFSRSKKNKAAWNSIKAIEVEYSTDSSFPAGSSVVTTGKAKTKAVLKNLERKTTYYVHVRYVDNAGGYSGWSKVKAVRTK